MPIRVRLDYNAQSFINIEDFVQSFGAVVLDLFKETQEVIAPQFLAELRYTPPRRYWESGDFQSDAQRRAFFAKTGGRPYQRTGQYAQSWKIAFKQTQDGGQIVISNTAPYAKFVGGSFARSGRDFQQRGHKRTGWPRSADTVDFWLTAATEDFEKRLSKYIDESFGKVTISRRNR